MWEGRLPHRDSCLRQCGRDVYHAGTVALDSVGGTFTMQGQLLRQCGRDVYHAGTVALDSVRGTFTTQGQLP